MARQTRVKVPVLRNQIPNLSSRRKKESTFLIPMVRYGVSKLYVHSSFSLEKSLMLNTTEFMRALLVDRICSSNEG